MEKSSAFISGIRICIIMVSYSVSIVYNRLLSDVVAYSVVRFVLVKLNFTINQTLNAGDEQ